MTDSSSTTTIQCPVSGCTWTYESGFNAEQSFRVLNIHVDRDHPSPNSQQVTMGKVHKLIPPTVDVGIDQEAWISFKLKWKHYCEVSQLSPEMQSHQLFFQCASESLGNLLLMGNDNIINCPSVQILAAIEHHAVIHIGKRYVTGRINEKGTN